MKVRHADLTSKYDHIVTSYCDEEGKKIEKVVEATSQLSSLIT